MGATDDQTLEPGTMLAHYRVESVLGSGAMGTVYRALDTSLDRSVAVKVLKPKIAGEPGILARFVREARAAARVNHSNLTHIYFVGREDKLQFFAMEYVPGETLEQLVQRRGPLPLEEGLDLLIDAARGLAAAHRGGVIHRDVKPSNLIRGESGGLKVTDFGLALSLDGDVRLTGGGTIMGTPTYMSPEQCRGGDTDERSDVYALGLCAWFVFGGHAPFDGDALGKVLEDQLTRDLPPLTELRPELPPALDDVLARLCAKRPEDRPDDMHQVATMLAALRPRPLRHAPFLARAFATGVDLFVVLVIGLALHAVATLAGQFLPELPSALLELPSALLEGVVTDLALLWIALFLFPWLEWRLGCSVGKYLFNLRVVRADGSPVTLKDAGLRLLVRFPAVLVLLLPMALLPADSAVAGVAKGVASLCVVLQLFAAGVGFPWMLFGDGRTLSDIITRTRVVYRFDDETTGGAAEGDEPLPRAPLPHA